jgi:hypothetical protein
VKTNGEHILFLSVKERQIDESSYVIEPFLHLKNGNDILNLSGPQSGEHALGPDAAAWVETAGGVKSLFIHDIASGQTRSLGVDATDFYLWDMNGRYLLVASQVPEPASWFLVLFASACLCARRREFR